MMSVLTGLQGKLAAKRTPMSNPFKATDLVTATEGSSEYNPGARDTVTDTCSLGKKRKLFDTSGNADLAENPAVTDHATRDAHQTSSTPEDDKIGKAEEELKSLQARMNAVDTEIAQKKVEKTSLATSMSNVSARVIQYKAEKAIWARINRENKAQEMEVDRHDEGRVTPEEERRARRMALNNEVMEIIRNTPRKNRQA